MMTKQMFLSELRTKLKRLPKNEIEDRIQFYSEMIDDRIEGGMSESAAVADIGSVDKICNRIISEIPLSKIVTERAKNKKSSSVWQIVLIILGSPIWLSLLVSVFAVIISLYVSLLAVVISLFAAELAIAVTAVLAVPVSIFAMFVATVPFGFALLGGAIALGGIAIFGLFGCKYIWLGALFLMEKGFIGIKKMFIGGNN